MANHAKKNGKVYLVGAGPGSADLITVRGVRALQKADCVVCDKLANPALLAHAPSDAEIIHTPKRIGPGSCTQQQINELIIEKARAGKTVVRLKGGDPCIFGRGAEEARLLAGAGIDFEIVPGITAAIAAAEYAGVMLTDRNYSSQVVFVTGREAADKEKSNIDWPWLAKFNGSIVLYMAMGSLEFIAEQLIDNGMAADTPAAVIENATLPTQKLVKAPLDSIAASCAARGIGPPAIIVIGSAAACEDNLNWFMSRPLFGRTIVITRDVRGNTDFADKIIEKGGRAIDYPTIKIEPLTDSTDFLQTLAKFNSYDWIIFTSGNGVRLFFEALGRLGKDARVFACASVAAIGTKTAEKLTQFGITADFVPEVFTGKELGRQLAEFTNLKNKKILLLRSRLASGELAEILTTAGAEVAEVPLYSITPLKPDSSYLTEQLKNDSIDWLTFASPSSARSFFERIPFELINSSRVRVASIGPVTSGELKGLEVKIDAEADEHTIDGLLAVIEGLCR